MATTKMSLKLLIDTKASKVLFAEAGKDFVDFLFGLLSLPVGAVIKLLTGRSSVGCIGNIYQSLGNLNESYMQSNLGKEILLNPKISTPVTNIPLLMDSSDSTTTKKFYTCNQNHEYVTNESDSACPDCVNRYGSCRGVMTRELKYVEGSGVGPAVTANTSVNGYVQGLVMYMVSDDLSVSPMSMVSSITMMNNCKVSKLDVLEERVVEVGMNEGLELLKASFQTEATLTAVFLGKREAETSVAFAAASAKSTKPVF